MYQAIKWKIKQQRVHLVTAHNLLSKQLKLKAEIIEIVRYSEKKLNQSLQLENLPLDKINNLREKLADDQRLYTECKNLIYGFRSDIETTKKEIAKSKLKLHHIIFPKKTCCFFKQKNDDESQASNHIDSFKDNIFKGA